MIHYAKVENSPRLQRILRVLADGAEHSTRNIITDANVCAVNTAISELRRNGYTIAAKSKGIRDGSHVYTYQWQWAKKEGSPT